MSGPGRSHPPRGSLWSRLFGFERAPDAAANRSAMKPWQEPPASRRPRLSYWMIAAFFGLVLSQLLWTGQGGETIPYSEFLQDLRGGRVAEVVLSDTSIQGKYTAPDAEGRRSFVTTRVEPGL